MLGRAMTRLYLDHAASTPLRPAAREAMLPLLDSVHGNPSSAHRWGREARKTLEDARDTVAAALHCKPREVVFTSGGTEANALAVLGAAGALPEGRRGVVTCATEHPAVLAPCRSLGAAVLPPGPDGRLDPTRFEAALSPQAGLASVMTANNETGVLHPLRELGEACRRRGVLLHTDAIQAVGHVPVDFSTLPVDLLSLTGHKLGGPRGCGALLVREGVRLKPLFLGGDHEGGRRAGTEHVAGAAGLAAALREAVEGMDAERARTVALRDRLLAGLRATFPDLVVHGEAAPRVPQTLLLSIPRLDATTALVALDQAGIAASGGSACHSGSADPSPVLAAMGVPAALARGALRFSLGHASTPAEVEDALAVLVPLLSRLRD